MRVLALGPFKVQLNGQIQGVGGPKQEALLARLFVAKGRAVPVARLCEELWKDSTPRNPVHALQARVSRLRSVLPLLDIELTGNGYRLDHRGVRTDIEQFETLREEGNWLLADGLYFHAADKLRQALAVWRGPAFTNLVDIPALQAEAARLEKLWAATLADRIDIDLALGNQADVIPELAGLVETTPLFERFWGQLMVALYREGRVQEALDAYVRARHLFSERFGVEPNSELGQLHVRILKEEPSETLLRLPLVTRTAPDAQPATNHATALHAGMNSNDTETVVALLQHHPALLLTGPAGIGKTHVLRSVRAHLEAQHCHAPLLAASELSRAIPLGVFTGVAGSLAPDWAGAVEVIETFARHRSQTVVLVDNVDKLDDASLFVVNQLVTTARVPVVLTVGDVTQAPPIIHELYDSGELTELQLNTLDDEQAYELSVAVAGGPLTPQTRLRIVQAAAGNPLRLREIITGSKDAGQLVSTDAGWELYGSPTPSARLAQLTGTRLDGLDTPSFEALCVVAIAGEYPGGAMDAAQRRVLARADVLALSDNGWLRLADPLDREVLRARCSEVLWAELTREAIQVLTSPLAADVPHARHRAHLLALDLGDPIDISATITLAQRALGTFDERLALRAAQAVIAQQHDHVEAHRIAGLAASILKMPQLAHKKFTAAQTHAKTARQIVEVADAHAQHYGLRRHDAHRALEIINQAFEHVTDPQQRAHLERSRMRWMAVAGMGGQVVPPPEMPADEASAMGLIMVGMSGVITGPLVEAHRTLAKLQEVPDHILDLVPGGRTLIELTAGMAVSYSGDLVSSMRIFRERIDHAVQHSPESLGAWEYGLGFIHLFSGDATKAYPLAVAAVEHLRWRDSAGLLPAAKALKIASAQVTGNQQQDLATLWATIPEPATQDPKVVMARQWTQAHVELTGGNPKQAAGTLVDVAQWLLSAQHTYFGAMCAHYAVRTGYLQHEALDILHAAHTIAGGGFLEFLVRHAETTLAKDHFGLRKLARQAQDLGMVATAADTWAVATQHPAQESAALQVQHQRAALNEIYAQAPGLVSWLT